MTGMIIGSSSPSGTTTGTGNGTTTGTNTGNDTSSADATKVAWNPDEQAIVQAALVDKKARHAISKMQDGRPSQGLFEESSPIKQTNLGIGGRMALRGTKKRRGRGRKPPTVAMNIVPNANIDAVLDYLNSSYYCYHYYYSYLLANKSCSGSFPFSLVSVLLRPSVKMITNSARREEQSRADGNALVARNPAALA
jgi:hypothetical protein